MRFLFQNSTKEQYSSETIDRAVLMERINKVISGESTEIGTNGIQDKELADQMNALIRKLRGNNRENVSRLNDSMEKATNNSIIEEMLETVLAQTAYINDMTISSKDLADSISNIRSTVQNIKKYVEEAVVTSNVSVDDMERSIEVVNQSAKDIGNINSMIKSFQAKTSKIHEIVDIVTKIAKQSNLLALNASIEAARVGEAGKGFAIVAGEVRMMSESTKASADDILRYVKELQSDTQELAVTIGMVSKNLDEGNGIVEESVVNIRSLNGQMATINEEMNSIYNYVDEQDSTTQAFVTSINEIANSYNEMKSQCNQAGAYLFETIRETDKIRGNIIKNSVGLENREYLRSFEVDHMVFSWRLYNAICKFETLSIDNVKDYKNCKLGKWCSNLTDGQVTKQASYRNLLKYHQELHEIATKCVLAIEKDNREQAVSYFEKASEVLQKLIVEIHSVMEFVSNE